MEIREGMASSPQTLYIWEQRGLSDSVQRSQAWSGHQGRDGHPCGKDQNSLSGPARLLYPQARLDVLLTDKENRGQRKTFHGQ